MDSNNHHAKPINVISVICDERKMQNIALTCRCGNRWTERIPGELHNSDMTAQFECEKCHTLYHLQNKQLRRAGEEYVREHQTTFDINRGYDA